MADNITLVLDFGSGTTKAGFAGDDVPRAVFPTVVGVPRRHLPAGLGISETLRFVGDSAQAKRGILNLRYPVEHGVVTSWTDFESILEHTFESELRTAPETTAVLVTECINNTRKNKETLTEIMFEHFGVGAYYTAIQGTD